MVDEGYVVCSSIYNKHVLKKCEQDVLNSHKIERFYALAKFHSKPDIVYGYTFDRYTIATGNWKKDKKNCLKEVKRFLD